MAYVFEIDLSSEDANYTKIQADNMGVIFMNLIKVEKNENVKIVL